MSNNTVYILIPQGGVREKAIILYLFTQHAALSPLHPQLLSEAPCP